MQIIMNFISSVYSGLSSWGHSDMFINKQLATKERAVDRKHHCNTKPYMLTYTNRNRARNRQHCKEELFNKSGNSCTKQN